MEKRVLGDTGLTVSILGFGSGPIGHLDTDRREVASILNALLDRGVNLIDTAGSYLGSEEMIGESISHRRDEYVLVSKCGQAFAGLEGPAWSAAMISQTVDRALRRLRTDRLDVMLLHSCDLQTLQKGEAPRRSSALEMPERFVSLATRAITKPHYMQSKPERLTYSRHP